MSAQARCVITSPLLSTVSWCRSSIAVSTADAMSVDTHQEKQRVDFWTASIVKP